MDCEEIQEQTQFEELIQGLINNEYGCCNDFLLPSIIIGLNDNIQNYFELDKMKLSGFGNNTNFKQDKSIRGDRINWIGNESTNQFEMIYLKKMEKFILYLNKTCFTAIKSFECHYASYQKGSLYTRHIDQFKNEKGRKFSMVLYLNQEWKEEDKGLLSLYPKIGNQVDISPLAGRMVLFRSDEMEHEVIPSFTRDRNSIAGWLKD